MKKILLLTLTVTLAIILLACVSNTQELSTTNSTTALPTVTTTELLTTDTTTTITTNEVTTINTTTEKPIVSYENPVYEPVLADPSIIKGDDGFYYVYGTQDYGEWDGEYGTRYIPILKSADLVNWEYTTSAFTLQTRPIWGTPNAGLWAPDIVKIGSTYNLYYSLSTWGDPNPGIGVATSTTPVGPWTDHGKLFDSNSIGVNNSIDPTVFLDDDGNVYIIWGSFRGIYGVQLSNDGLSLKDGDNAKNTKVLIAGYETSQPWNGSTYEASYILRKDGYYYLFLSSGTCCEGFSSSYNVKVGRSTSPLGPYFDDEDRSMLAGNRGYQVVQGSAYFVGPGHNSVIQDEAGDYWMLYHAYDTGENPTLGNTNRRTLMIDKLIWNDDDWPSVFGKMPSNRVTVGPVT